MQAAIWGRVGYCSSNTFGFSNVSTSPRAVSSCRNLSRAVIANMRYTSYCVVHANYCTRLLESLGSVGTVEVGGEILGMTGKMIFPKEESWGIKYPKDVLFAWSRAWRWFEVTCWEIWLLSWHIKREAGAVDLVGDLDPLAVKIACSNAELFWLSPIVWN